jgi:hypothetical protein
MQVLDCIDMVNVIVMLAASENYYLNFARVGGFHMQGT